MNSNIGQEPRRAYGRWAEDVGFKIVSTPAGRYLRTPVGEISFARIVRTLSDCQLLVGFVWFSDEENAAGYTSIASNDVVSGRAGIVWVRKIDEGCAQGITPSARFAELLDIDMPEQFGHIAADSVQRIESLSRLRTLAKTVSFRV
ncbi:hypothetical protein [Mycetocola lacteus]|uniref:hypothetical protein n=1 Tax=Mycetocola lacteus TaxID=76637 RepID=UPI0011C3D339|nr:hypothetical protein [Mycetocola lacteus]